MLIHKVDFFFFFLEQHALLHSIPYRCLMKKEMLSTENLHEECAVYWMYNLGCGFYDRRSCAL